MPMPIEMPKLSDTMTEGTLVRWLKKVGDTVAVGDVIAEVETDKATMEMEAFDEGVLGEICVNEGQKVEIGQKLALLLQEGGSSVTTCSKRRRPPKKDRSHGRNPLQQRRSPRSLRPPRTSASH